VNLTTFFLNLWARICPILWPIISLLQQPITLIPSTQTHHSFLYSHKSQHTHLQQLTSYTHTRATTNKERGKLSPEFPNSQTQLTLLSLEFVHPCVQGTSLGTIRRFQWKLEISASPTSFLKRVSICSSPTSKIFSNFVRF